MTDEAARRAAGGKRRLTSADSADGKKRCSRCRQVLALDQFGVRPARPGGYHRGRQTRCKRCQVEVTTERRLQDPSAVARMNHRAHARLKKAVFEAYGGPHPHCACCGESEEVFLALDHVDNDGALHRRELRKNGRTSQMDVYRDLVRRGFPPKFQILCHNCNWAKHMGGCPHIRRAAVS